MDLHSEITYYITNVIFTDFCYVEMWHDVDGETPKSKFKSYKQFKKNFISVFNKENIKLKFPYYLYGPEYDDGGDEDDVVEKYENDKEKFIEVLKNFYPILRTSVSEFSIDDSLIQDLLDNVIDPYFRKW